MRAVLIVRPGARVRRGAKTRLGSGVLRAISGDAVLGQGERTDGPGARTGDSRAARATLRVDGQDRQGDRELSRVHRTMEERRPRAAAAGGRRTQASGETVAGREAAAVR